MLRRQQEVMIAGGDLIGTWSPVWRVDLRAKLWALTALPGSGAGV